ncbi:hypothetical protein C1H46_038449 [Malus baccata]|uniref:Uncharacterized protein n=1 Tax=Malus baccata TaxID=106549 RepID=A0A540KP74_MALBA|nr:hypothetical protein C1H46_038449 [Malus baccata]
MLFKRCLPSRQRCSRCRSRRKPISTFPKKVSLPAIPIPASSRVPGGLFLLGVLQWRRLVPRRLSLEVLIVVARLILHGSNTDQSFCFQFRCSQPWPSKTSCTRRRTHSPRTMMTPCDSDVPTIIPTVGVAMAAEAVEEEEGLPLLAHLSLRKAYARECACLVLPLRRRFSRSS